jgi:hypothetical protein
MKAISKVVGAAVLMVLGTAYQAQALAITPALAIASGNQTSQSDIDTALAALGVPLPEKYKQDVGGAESGPLAGSYNTVFLSTPTDPSGATITYTGGPIVGPTAYLLVKDGAQTPAWYLFNLTALGWTGTQQLDLSGFWPQQGAISHVALYGGTVTVPDGGMTITLLGSTLVGLGLLRRKFNV